MKSIRKIFNALTGKERVVMIVSSFVALASGLSLGIAIVGEATHSVPTQGGDYVEGFLGQPVYVNPVLASSEVDKSIVRLVFSNLKDLAEKITPGEDGRTWKVRLKENLRWQDGTKITSDDVIFTVQRIQDGESRSPLFSTWQGVAAERSSELELQFSLVNPYTFFPEVMERLYPIPKHIFGEVPPANWRLSDYNLKPIGSGPFVFSDYKKRPGGFITHYALAAFKEYPGKPAFIRTFSFKFYSRKADLLQDFNSGNIDATANLEPEDVPLIRRPHDTATFRVPTYYAVFFNQGKNVPLKDPFARKALASAVDKEALVLNALANFGDPAWGPIPENSPYFSESLGHATNSLAIAQNILEEGQWKLNASGTREKVISKSAIQLKLSLTVPDVGFLKKTAEALKTTWEKLGIQVDLVSMPMDDIRTAIKNRDYELLLFGTVLGKSYDLYPFWHSSQRFHPGLNLALYSNKKTDSLIEEIRTDFDTARQTSQFFALQQTIIADYPAVFLYSPYRVFIFKKSLRGVESISLADPADRFRKAPRWYLRTARVLK